MCKKVTLNKAKFVKGQVWLLDENPEVTRLQREDGSHVINGKRPYVIVKCNGNTCTCLPMTTNVTNEKQSENDIVVMGSPENDIPDSRIVMSITTKSNNEFIRYLYTFDEESTDFIMASVNHYIFGGPKPASSPSEVKEEETETEAEPVKDELIEETKKTPTPRVEKKVLPKCPYEQVEYHLTHRKPRESLFRTAAEARTWIEFWDGHATKEIADHYKISVANVSNWRSKARQTIEQQSFSK